MSGRPRIARDPGVRTVSCLTFPPCHAIIAIGSLDQVLVGGTPNQTLNLGLGTGAECIVLPPDMDDEGYRAFCGQ